MPKLEAQRDLRKAYQSLVDGKSDFAKFEERTQGHLAKTVISDRDATSYARFVMQAVRVLRQGYFKEINSAQLVDQGVRGLFRNIDEVMPPAILERLDTIKSLKDADLSKLLTDVRKHLGKREDLEGGKDITLTLHALLRKLDRHTDYIDPDTAKKMETLIQGNFTGIGVQIRRNLVKDLLQVVTPIINSPAYKAGLQANDLITEITRIEDDQGNPIENPKVLSTKGMPTEDAVKNILGPAGTKVKLTVQRDGEEKPLEFELIRGRVEVESVLGFKRYRDDKDHKKDTWDYVIDPENKICYVRLTDFTASTAADLQKVMKHLAKEAGIKGFILDLRFNPGGRLDSRGRHFRPVHRGRDDRLHPATRKARKLPTSARATAVMSRFPMVCLINGSSASASEIVSACLQDHHRAIIIGEAQLRQGERADDAQVRQQRHSQVHDGHLLASVGPQHSQGQYQGPRRGRFGASLPTRASYSSSAIRSGTTCLSSSKIRR